MRLPEKKYYRLKEVADQWACTVEDLLSFGENGQIQLCIVLESTLLEEMKSRLVNENDLSNPLFRIVQRDSEEPVEYLLERIGIGNKAGVYPLSEENVLLVGRGEPIKDIEDLNDGCVSYRFGLFDDSLEFQPIERKFETTDLVITHKEKLRFEEACDIANDGNIGEKERSTWLKIIYLLTHELADHKPVLVKTDGLNISQLETILKKTAKKHDLPDKGLSNSTLSKIYNEAITELEPDTPPPVIKIKPKK